MKRWVCAVTAVFSLLLINTTYAFSEEGRPINVYDLQKSIQVMEKERLSYIENGEFEKLEHLKKRFEYACFYYALKIGNGHMLFHFIENEGLDPYLAIDGRNSVYHEILRTGSLAYFMGLYRSENENIDKERMFGDAIQFGTPNMVSSLLNESKVDVNSIDVLGVPLVWFAMKKFRYLDNFKALLKYGNIDFSKSYCGGNTLLHEVILWTDDDQYTVAQNYLVRIAMLLQKGANPYATNDEGFNCFDFAPSNDVIELLQQPYSMDIPWDSSIDF